MRVKSDMLLVGGILDFDIDFPSPPAEALIRCLTVSIVQTLVVTLSSGEVVTASPQVRALLHLDGVTKFPSSKQSGGARGASMDRGKKSRDRSTERRRFVRLAPDSPWSLHEVLRVPSDDVRLLCFRPV